MTVLFCGLGTTPKATIIPSSCDGSLVLKHDMNWSLVWSTCYAVVITVWCKIWCSSLQVRPKLLHWQCPNRPPGHGWTGPATLGRADTIPLPGCKPLASRLLWGGPQENCHYKDLKAHQTPFCVPAVCVLYVPLSLWRLFVLSIRYCGLYIYMIPCQLAVNHRTISSTYTYMYNTWMGFSLLRTVRGISISLCRCVPGTPSLHYMWLHMRTRVMRVHCLLSRARNHAIFPWIQCYVQNIAQASAQRTIVSVPSLYLQTASLTEKSCWAICCVPSRASPPELGGAHQLLQPRHVTNSSRR